MGSVNHSAAAYRWSVLRSPGEVEALIVGDVNVQRRRDPPSAFAHLAPTLHAADLRYGNLEGLFGDPDIVPIQDKKRWRYSEHSMIEAYVAGGFDVFGCANNVNYGHRELLETLQILDEKGIAHTGAGRTDAEAHTPAVVERAGVRFGFLQYTARYYGEYAIASADHPGVARIDAEVPADLERVRHDVSLLRPKVDVLAVSHHLRLSNVREVEPYQQDFGRVAAEAGADLVFGHGAHVNQHAEMLSGVPVFHCIGQLAFDWYRAREKREGLILRLLVANGRIRSISVVPVWRDENNDVYIAAPTTPEGRAQVDALLDGSPTVPFEPTDRDLVFTL